MTDPQITPEPSGERSTEPASGTGAAWQRPDPSAQPTTTPYTPAPALQGTDPTSAPPAYPASVPPPSGYSSAPQYSSPGYPGAAPPPNAYPAYSGQQPSGYPAGGGGGQVPPGGVPAWAMPEPKPRPVAKILVGTALAAILALSAGLVGGVIGATYGSKEVVRTTTVAAAPVIDRTSLASIAAAVQPSVVSIKTETGEGSGVVMTADGYILTNNHVVATAQGSNVTVVLSDGSRVQATIIGTDPKSDLAIIQAKSTNLTPAKFADNTAVQVGDTVLAIGSPLGLEGSVTEGIISAKDRTITISGMTMTGLLQTDAAINPGNSGGALVNTKGEVVGINSAIATNGGSEGNIGVGFAIPSAKAKSIAEQLQRGEKVSHAFLGVKVGTADAGGATISTLTANGPAEKAGLKVGDVITKFGDKSITSNDDLVAAVQAAKAGDQVVLTIVRDGATQTATVTLGTTS